MFKQLTIAAALALAVPSAVLAKDKGPAPAEVIAQADISVGLSGLVCDFCSIALNKTFKKNEAVAATHVDLDSKTLSIMLKDDADMDDATVEKLVKKAGYNVTGIERKTAS